MVPDKLLLDTTKFNKTRKEPTTCGIGPRKVFRSTSQWRPENPPKIPKYQKKHRAYTNFFEKFARTFALFL